MVICIKFTKVFEKLDTKTKPKVKKVTILKRQVLQIIALTNVIPLVAYSCSFRPSENQSSTNQSQSAPASNEAVQETTPTPSAPSVQLSDLQSILSNMESKWLFAYECR